MRKKLTLWFVVITVMLDAAGFGIIIPVMPDLIDSVAGVSFSETSRIGGYLILAFGLTQFLFGPLIGNLSDAYGRRPVLLISLLGLVIDYIIMALAPSLAWLMLGRILGGITSATHATANAVIADISDDDEKAVNFGLMGAAFGFGFVLGPIIGGVLSLAGERAPFWGAAGIACANLIFGFLVFRESLPKSGRRKFEWRRSNPVGSFFVLQSKPVLWLFAVIFFFYNLAFTVYPSIWTFFAKYRYGFEPWAVAVTLGMFGICMVFSQGVLIRPAMKYLGARNIVNYGLLLEGIVFLSIALLFDWHWLIIVLPLSAVASITGPAFQDLVTRLVSKSEQGELQGILASIISLTGLLGTFIMTQSFAHFIEDGRDWVYDGVPFLIAAASVILAWMVYQSVLRDDHVKHQIAAQPARQNRKR